MLFDLMPVMPKDLWAQIVTITDGEPTAHIEDRDIVLIYPPAEKSARVTLG